MKGISIIICCYNSANRLPETVKHIALQQVPDSIQWEVIIIDNASTDNTPDIALTAWQQYNRTDISYRIVTEPQAGLSYARKKGAHEAVFDYLVFCDDDNWLCDTYVASACNLMDAWPATGVIGGWGVARLDADKPFWFDKYNSCYATGQQNIVNGKIEGNSPYVYGAGAVVRKSVFNKIDNMGIQLLATDRLNDKLSSGGDVELCYLAKLMGYDISYSSQLRFTHDIGKTRLQESYLLSLMYQLGYCNAVHRPYYWMFEPLPKYKKSWLWTLIISLNIFIQSKIKLSGTKSGEEKFFSMVDVIHAKGRLMAIMKLKGRIEAEYQSLKLKFNT